MVMNSQRINGNKGQKHSKDTIGQKDKPIIISHHMLSGLKKDQAKMSKSDVNSAIFMEDSRVYYFLNIGRGYIKNRKCLLQRN